MKGERAAGASRSQPGKGRDNLILALRTKEIKLRYGSIIHSVVGPDLHLNWSSGSGSGRAKMNQKNNKVKKVYVLKG